MARVEADEARMLAPATDQMRREINQIAQHCAAVEAENEELASLLIQQQALISDAQAFLMEFDRRRTTLLDEFARLIGGPVPTT
jgi:DNA repair exonuclease SbcCD ATPase subunit